jgi:hypothetical protein
MGGPSSNGERAGRIGGGDVLSLRVGVRSSKEMLTIGRESSSRREREVDGRKTRGGEKDGRGEGKDGRGEGKVVRPAAVDVEREGDARREDLLVREGEIGTGRHDAAERELLEACRDLKELSRWLRVSAAGEAAEASSS